ncbi:hypothetical protein DK847_00585 [Aestuariivirga litoralis]|uniref:Uncharacterized protein n=1 Tax=Aestuariivirga litoralis TaxID=2650924 RepID=A0A2W2BDN5_9HYPH|nr:hypothetical protein [Aestuariivirga litoralis]PZF78354.1 hypothetical protein DK847_00585 [Aestuariivirga litoralis]
MIRYAIILIAAMGTVAGAAAMQNAPAAAQSAPLTNQTVIEKNSPFPVLGPLVVTECRLDDCSDVPNG